jgi:hypothetical protein
MSFIQNFRQQPPPILFDPIKSPILLTPHRPANKNYQGLCTSARGLRPGPRQIAKPSIEWDAAFPATWVYSGQWGSVADATPDWTRIRALHHQMGDGLQISKTELAEIIIWPLALWRTEEATRGGVNGSQFRFLTGTWPISKINLRPLSSNTPKTD